MRLQYVSFDKLPPFLLAVINELIVSGDTRPAQLQILLFRIHRKICGYEQDCPEPPEIEIVPRVHELPQRDLALHSFQEHTLER